MSENVGNGLDFSGIERFTRAGREKEQKKDGRKKAITAYSGGKSSGKGKSIPHDTKTSGQNDRNQGNTHQDKKDREKFQQNRKDGRMPNWNFNKYVGAPYNFVPISEKTYDYKDHNKNVAYHNDLNKNLLSGCITYQIQAKTPILVDGGKKDSNKQGTGEFYRDAYGNYAIPGSSIRGLVRNNAQILSFADVGEDIDDYNLMYRNVAAGLDKELYTDILGAKPIPIGKEGKSISILKNVKAGYIEKKGKEYLIYRTKVEKIHSDFGEMNYYVVSERLILEDYQRDVNQSKFQYLYSSGLTMQYTKDCKFIEQKNKWTNQPTYVAEEPKQMFNGRLGGPYRPYYREISYEIHGLRKVEAIGEPGKYSRKGYLLSSGAMNMKKVIYIVPEIDREQDYIVIPEKDADSYRRDYEGKKTQIKGAENFFGLPQEGEVKPVFYIEYDGRLYFGFTPRLRLFYENSVKDGLRQKATELDYCKALFGYTGQENSYKSRISFQDAATENGKESELCELILGAPKPTSYLDYIESVDGAEKVVTYNDEFRLRGIKQYWLKEQEKRGDGNQGKNKNVGSKLKPLCAGTVFRGKIRFHNLTEDELGLLIWSLELNPESEQNIGKAKAYGYGRVKITIDGVEIFKVEEAYDFEQFSLRPFCLIGQEEKEGYVNCFKAEMQKWLGRKPEESESIRSFLLMKDSRLIPDAENTRYMSIDKREYQERVKAKYPLPKIDKVVKK